MQSLFHAVVVVLSLLGILSRFSYSLAIASANVPYQQQNEHLVVLVHGLMGTSRDLEYLSQLLQSKGCVVLSSQANEQTNSLKGIEKGASRLVEEILAVQAKNKQLKKLSFVGNSLGGLYARYASMLLYDKALGTMGDGLEPHKFMTIATPHLGVRNHIFVEEMLGVKLHDALKLIVSKTMFSTGKDLFGHDNEDVSKTLIYRLATQESFLAPLRLFASRRLYANLRNDFVVPLGTAAFLDEQSVRDLRSRHLTQSGIVAEAHTEKCSDALNNTNNALPQEQQQQQQPTQLQKKKQQQQELGMSEMRRSLDCLGWEKYVVHFPGLVPIAHNKLASLRRWPDYLYSNVLGFAEGEYVMQHACEFLTS